MPFSGISMALCGTGGLDGKRLRIPAVRQPHELSDGKVVRLFASPLAWVTSRIRTQSHCPSSLTASEHSGHRAVPVWARLLAGRREFIGLGGSHPNSNACWLVFSHSRAGHERRYGQVYGVRGSAGADRVTGKMTRPPHKSELPLPRQPVRTRPTSRTLVCLPLGSSCVQTLGPQVIQDVSQSCCQKLRVTGGAGSEVNVPSALR
jgi:hypothetical protein